jgi:hypothetical protein
MTSDPFLTTDEILKTKFVDDPFFSVPSLFIKHHPNSGANQKSDTPVFKIKHPANRYGFGLMCSQLAVPRAGAVSRQVSRATAAPIIRGPMLARHSAAARPRSGARPASGAGRHRDYTMTTRRLSLAGSVSRRESQSPGPHPDQSPGSRRLRAPLATAAAGDTESLAGWLRPHGPAETGRRG